MMLNDLRHRFSSVLEVLHELIHHPSGIAGLVILSIIILITILAPVISPYDPTTQDWENILSPPSIDHLFGTDEYGRDVMSRIFWGSRITLMAGLFVVSIAALIGTILGLVAGYYEGIIGNIIMRLTDLFLAFPSLLLAILIVATIGRGIMNAMLALVVSWWPWYCRLAYGQTLSIKQELYIEAEKSIGASDLRIIFRHILPQAFPPILVQITMDLGYAILAEASLSFIGLGVRPPTPEWGSMIAEARKYLLRGCWWLFLWPGIFLFLAIIGFILLGDGLNDILNPKIRSLMELRRLYKSQHLL